ncbi:hypothetical protein [Croceibacterium ferulae]|uniref:hypothetical protein n=1 Tax=Croceibacterium ferulae TaxID=1854641 RepID=UPI001F4D73CA|nr:hypothetical protein [Croceibacterium ferulae]
MIHARPAALGSWTPGARTPPFFLTQALLPVMADGGHIVNVASATSRVAAAGVAPVE